MLLHFMILSRGKGSFVFDSNCKSGKIIGTNINESIFVQSIANSFQMYYFYNFYLNCIVQNRKSNIGDFKLQI